MKGVLVADFCQGRFEKERLLDYLSKNVIVLITGSKFFRGPPFSGGVIVPSVIMEELQELGSDCVIPDGLNSFIGKNEVPRELRSWRNQLGDNQNPSLALRWVAALAEMEPTLNISKEIRESATDEWRSSVIEHLNQYPNLSYFDAAEDSPSIISVRIRHPVTNKWMIKSELVKIFKDQTLDVSSQYPQE